MAAADARQLVALKVWDLIAPFCRSPTPNVPLGSLTSSAQIWPFPALTDTAVFPAPRSTGGRFDPISARREQDQE